MQPPAFSTQTRNDTRQTRARAVQVAPVPADNSASDAPACASGTEETRPAPGRWFGISGYDSSAADGGAAALSSRGAVGAQEAEAKLSPESAGGRHVHRLLAALKWMQSLACARGRLKWNLTHLLHCSTGTMVPGGEDSEPYMVSTVLDSEAGISCVSEVTVYALQKQFSGVDVVQPYDGEQDQVVIADGGAVPIERQRCSLTATIMTPWASVTSRLALTVMSGKDDSLILRSRTLREKVIIDVMKQLGTRLRHRGAVRVARRILSPSCRLYGLK